MKKFMTLTAVALLASTTFASAATLSFLTTTAPFKQLGVTGPSKVTLTLISRAASSVSQSLVGDWGVFSNTSTAGTSFSYDLLQGTTDSAAADFAYLASYKLTPTSPSLSGALQNLFHIRNGSAAVSVAYSAITSFYHGQSITAFFNNGDASSSGDEMTVRIDVQEIPVPAAGALLLSGLGGLGLVRRRRKA